MAIELLASSAVLTPRRKQTQSTFKGAGKTDIIQLGKQNLYRDIYIRLQATLTMSSGAANTVAATLLGDEWAILSKIRLVTNSTDVLLDMSGHNLFMVNMVEMGLRPWLTPTLGDGASASVVVDSTLCIPAWSRMLRKPMDSAFESYRYGSLQLELTYETFTAVHSAATAYASSPTVEISSSEAAPNPTAFIPSFIPRRYSQTFDFTAAQTAGRFALDTGPYYTHLLINIQNAAGTADLAATLTNLKLISATTTIIDLSATVALQQGYAQAKMWNGQEINAAATGIVSQTKNRVSTQSSALAWYFIPIISDGYATEALRNPVANDLFLEFQSSAAFKLNLISWQLFPNPAAQQAAAA